MRLDLKLQIKRKGEKMVQQTKKKTYLLPTTMVEEVKLPNNKKTTIAVVAGTTALALLVSFIFNKNKKH